MKRLILVLIFIVGLAANVRATGLVRSSSNTLIFTEDYSDTTYIDTASYYSYTFRLAGGVVRQQNHITWDWDTPVADIVYSQADSSYYIIYEKYNDVPADGYGMRPDIFLYKVDENGTALWSRSVWVRNRTNVEWGGSRYPSITVDNNANVYVAWRDYDTSINKYVIAIQKFDSSGKPKWNNGLEINGLTNVYHRQSPRLAYYNGYVFVVASYRNNNRKWIHLQKINATNGNLMFTNPIVVNSDTSANVYNPDIKVGGDKLYIVWTKNFNNIYIQRINPANGSRDFSSDVKVNTNTGYYYKYFWYGTTEDDVVLDVDDNTNIFVAWSAGDSSSEQQVYLQKLDKNLNRQWTSDIKVPGAMETVAAYPSITVEPNGNSVYVTWISHRSGYNDNGYMQKINGVTGSKIWANDLNIWQNYGFRHGGRIIYENGWVYTIGVSGYFQKFDGNGNRFFNGRKSILDRPYFVRTKFDSLTVIPGVVEEVKFKETSVTKENNSKVLYRFTGDGNNWTSYFTPTNNVITITLTSNKGNDFRYGALLDSKSDLATNDWGVYKCELDQIQIEATKVYLGDMLISKYDTGADAIGDLIINLSSENQEITKYVYNNGTNGAVGYFLVKNNGNIETNFKITGTKGTSDWTINYYLCSYNGSVWVTNRNITSEITNSSGFQTNISPFNDNYDIVAIMAKAVPSSSLSIGDTFTVTMKVAAQFGTTWFDHDTSSMTVVIKDYKPDLQIGIVTNNGVVDDYKGDNIYTVDGTYQDKFQKVDTNVIAIYYIKVENDGKDDTIKVTGNSGNANWNVKYYTGLTGGSDITANITGSGQLFTLNGSSYTQIRVEITPLTPSIGAEFTNLIQAQSTNAAESDGVLAITRRVESKVDILVKRAADSSYIGDNIYNTNGVNQTLTNNADNGMTNVFYCQVYNEGSEALDIALKADYLKSLNPDWDVRYYHNGNDITSQITDQYVLSNLAQNGYETITVKISPPQTFATGANELMMSEILGWSKSAPNKYAKMDKVKAYTKCVTSQQDLVAVNSTNLNIGRDIISNSYVNQNSFEFISHLITNNYTLIITNNAPSSYRVKITASEENYNNWEISYLNNGTNVRNYLLTGGWITPDIPPYGRETINISVHPLSAVPADETNKITFNSVSLINPEDVDVVRFSTSRIFPPDLLVKKTNQPVYGGDNEYGTNIAAQESGGSISTNIIIQGNTNDYYYLVKLQNDRTLPETVKLNGTGSDTNFMVRYWKYIGTNINNPEINDNTKWSNITTIMTSVSGYTLYNINGGTNILFRVGVRVTNTNVQEGDSIITKFYATGLAANYQDMVRLVTTYGIARPDLIINSNWNDVYELSNVIVQRITNIIDKAKGTNINFIIQNDSSLNKGTFLVKGQNDVGDWRLKYYDHTSDVSAQVKSSFGYTKILNTYSSATMQMQISIATESTYTNGYSYEMFLSVEPEDGPNLKDECRIVNIVTDRGRPDISLTNNEWNDFYEVTVSSQVYKYLNVEKGHTASLKFYIGNDRSDIPEMLRFKGTGNLPYYMVKYYYLNSGSWIDVTSDVVGSEFHKIVNNNSIVTMKFEVTLASNAPYNVGDIENFDISLTSQGKLVKDVARIITKVVDYGKPDISFTNGDWNDVWEDNNPVQQITNFYIEKSYTNRYYLYAGNDKAEDEILTLLGSTNKGDFSVSYFIITNGVTNDISSNVKSYGASFLVKSNNHRLIRVDVSLLSNSNYTFDSNFTINLKLKSQAGFVNDTVRLIVNVTDYGKPDLALENGQFSNQYYPPVQETNIQIEKGFVYTNIVYLYNELNSRSERFRFRGKKIDVTSWTLNGYRSDWNDFPYWTNSPPQYFTIPPISCSTLYFLLKVDEDSSYGIGAQNNTSFTLESYGKLKKDILKLTYTITDRGRPDLVYMQGFQGDGDYEGTTPVLSQKYTNLIEKGETMNVYFLIQNDNLDRGERLRFYGEGTKGDFTVNNYYFKSNSSWISVPPMTQRKIFVDNNSSVTMYMQISLAAGSSYGTNVIETFNLNLKSQGQQVQDNMLLVFKVADKGRPNIALTNGKWTNYVETIPNFQITNTFLEKGYTNELYLDLWNKRTNRGETFTLKGDSGPGVWAFNYFLVTNSTLLDITSDVIGSGRAIYVGTNTNRRVLIKTGLPLNADYNLGDSSSNVIELISQNGYAKDSIKIVTYVTDYGRPDLVFASNGFNNIYYPATQQTNIYIEKGFYWTNYLYLNNDLTNIRPAEIFNFKADKSYGDWNISYLYKTNSSFTDVTGSVTSSAGRNFNVPSNSSVTLAVVMFVDSSSSYTYGDYHSFNTYLYSQGNLVEDRMSLVYSITSFAQPDLSLTNGLGTNTYESTPVTVQLWTNDIEKGHTNTILFVCGNDSFRAESLRFYGEKSYEYFITSYYYHTTNVTSDATNETSGFQIPIPANSIKTMAMKVYLKPDATYDTNSFHSFDIYLKSQGKLKEDHFIVYMRVCDKGMPDISLTNGQWNDVYEYVPFDDYPVSTQFTNFYIEKGYTNKIYLNLGNDKFELEKMHFRASSNQSDFIVTYEIATNGADITSDVTTSTGALLSINSYSTMRLIANVYLLSNSNLQFGDKYNLNLILESQGKFKKEKASITVSVTDYGRPDLFTKGNFTNQYYPTSQQLDITAEKGFTITNFIYLGNNLGSIRNEEKYLFNASSPTGEWYLSYLYFTNGSFTNVTGSVTNGRYFSVPQNSSITLAAVMSIQTDCSYPIGEIFTTTMTLLSQGKLVKDIMKFKYTINDTGVPDITLTNSGSIWSTTYENSNNITVQIWTNGIELKNTNDFYFYLENDNTNRGETLSFIGDKSSGDYTIDYLIKENGSFSNITEFATNEYKVFIPNSSRKTMAIRCAILSNSGLTTNNYWDIKLRVLSQGKFKQDSAIVHYIVVDKGKPDIVLTNGQWNDVYESDYSNQVAYFYVEPRVTNVYLLQIQNDKSAPEILHLQSNPGNNVFNITFSRISNSMTNDITAGITNQYGINLPFTANSTQYLKIDVTVNTGVNYSFGTNMDLIINLYSEARFNRDQIKLITYITDFGKPDLVLTNGQWNDVYYPSEQDNNIYIEKGFIVTNYFRVQNDNTNRVEIFSIKMNSPTNYWTLNIFYITNGSNIDITSEVTNSGREIKISNNSSISLMATMLLDIDSPYTNSITNTYYLDVFSHARLVKDRLNLNYILVDKSKPDIFLTNSKWSNKYYWENPTTQSTNFVLEKGQSNTFTFILKNETNRAERFGVKIDDFFDDGWFIKVLIKSNSNWIDVTESATNFYKYITLSGQSSTTMRCTIGVYSNNPQVSGFTNKINLKLYSQTKIRYDRILLKAILSIPQPDLLVKSESGSFIGNDVYTNGVDINNNNGEIVTGRAFFGYQLTYFVKVQNDDAIPDSIFIKTVLTNVKPGKWEYNVFELVTTNGTITTNNVYIPLAYGHNWSLAPGSSVDFLVKVKMKDKNVDVDEPFNLIFKAISGNNTNKIDMAAIVAKRQPVEVTGKLVDITTGVALSGAKFNIAGKVYTSDANGIVSFENLPGTYDITITANNYLIYTGELSIPDAPSYDFGTIGLIPFNLDNFSLNIHTFPNPVEQGEDITFVFNVPKDGNVTIEIYDLFGRLIYTPVDNVHYSKGKYNFDWNGVDNNGKIVRRGVYIVVITEGVNKNRHKIFIK